MNTKTLSVQHIHFLVAFLVSSEAFALEYDINSGLILDRINDTTNWKLSATNLTNWFEYFDNTSQLTGNRQRTCSEIISNSFNNLDKAEGIWVACENSTAPIECDMFASSCYPEITAPKGLINISYVKIRIALLGFATFRFNFGSYFCIDYSYRKDPMSRCQFVEILPQLEWVDAEISTDDNLNVSSLVYLMYCTSNDCCIFTTSKQKVFYAFSFALFPFNFFPVLKEMPF